MTLIILLLFLVSFLLFISAIRYSIVLKKSRMYPPKRIIKQRIQTLATCGVVLLLLGVLIFYFPVG